MWNTLVRIVAVLWLAGSATFSTVAHAGAEPLVDQEQPIIDATVGGLAIGGASQQGLAQVVTQGSTGFLTEVRFPVTCSSGDLIVEIQGVDGDRPNGIVLTSQTVPGSTLPPFSPSPPSFRSLALSTPVSLSSGERFAIVLSSAGACGVFRGPTGDPYAGGDLFFDTRPNPQGIWICECEFLDARFDLPFQTIVAVDQTFLAVLIDIKPGAYPNSINLGSAGVIPVAILSSETFDARTIDPESVRLAGAAVRMVGKSGKLLCHEEDVNGDGHVDLVCQVETVELAIEPGESVAMLVATTASGQTVRGEDSVRIVPD
jgi:hypothetical protein